MSNPVFFDPEGKRRKRASLGLTVLGLVLAVLTTLTIVSFFAVPLLPKIKGLNDTLHRPAHLIPALPDIQKRKALYLVVKARQALDADVARDTKLNLAEMAKAKKPPPGSPIVAAFYAPWESNGISSFREHAKDLTHVIPAWMALDRSDPARMDLSQFNTTVSEAGLTPPDQRLIDIARLSGVHIWPLLSNMYDGVANPGIVKTLLDSADKQTALAGSIRDWLVQNGFEGLNVDFEGLEASDYDRLPQFLDLLHKTLRAAKLGLSIDLEAGDNDLMVRRLSQNVDLAIVMAYDDHDESGAAGPIAPIPWTEDVLDRFAAVVPSNKLVIGIGNYAYDWSPTSKKADSQSFQGALKTAENFRDAEGAAQVLQFDPISLNAHFIYDDEDNAHHSVWILDGVSAFNQWKLAQGRVRGSALWVLGLEDPSTWDVLNRQAVSRPPDPHQLTSVAFGPDDLEMEGAGDLLYAKGQLKDAQREVKVDPSAGLVVGETYQGYPSGYYVEKAGFSGPKTLALTFDDGPDAVNTPAVLDALQQLNVQATFFVIGRNAEQNPDLLRRIYDEGHEIGSHTFNHPNLNDVSDERTELELNATQRAIQGITGRTTALFRPPYNADSEPSKPEDVRPIMLASRLGYVTVGESIDPQDWRIFANPDNTGARRTPQEIVDAILFQISQKEHGNSILLHDGGGDRSATIAALKLLVPMLREKGYRFVTVSSLLGVSRDVVMPRVGSRDRALIGLDQFAFTTFFTFEWILRLAFLVAIALGLARVILITPLAIAGKRRKFIAVAGFQPPVSVLIAAYNEEKVIARTIRSILASEYRVEEVVVVDDGSADATFLEVATQFAGDPRVVILRQENGGKASALNRALSQAKGDVLVCVDADTQLKPDAIGFLVRHFQDRQIGAVAGNVKVGNRVNLLTRWQSVEYITSQNLDREAYGLLDAISVCPGAIGAWRKSALVEVGGYVSDTLAEDMDLTWRLQRAGWRIQTEAAAVAYTEAPDTFKGFFGQRFRWTFGTLQCLWKHRRALGRHGWFGWLTLPSLWLFQIVFQVLAPLVDLQLLLTAILFFTAWISRSEYTQDWRPAAEVQATLVSVAFLYGLFFTVELLSGFIAYRMDKEKARELWWLFLQRFVYRQIMYAVVWKSLVTAIRGRRQGWGKLERKATVEIG